MGMELDSSINSSWLPTPAAWPWQGYPQCFTLRQLFSRPVLSFLCMHGSAQFWLPNFQVGPQLQPMCYATDTCAFWFAGFTMRIGGLIRGLRLGTIAVPVIKYSLAVLPWVWGLAFHLSNLRWLTAPRPASFASLWAALGISSYSKYPGL